MPITADAAPESLLEEVSSPDRWLLPAIRACAFFNERGQTLSGSRTQPAASNTDHALHYHVQESLRLDVDTFTRTGATECIAVVRLRDEGSFATVCALQFAVDPNASNAEVEMLGKRLVPFVSHAASAVHGAIVETDSVVSTDMPTRVGLERQIRAQALMGAEDESSILCFNIDRLHLINETRGFDAGDRLIEQAARLLQRSLPSGALSAHLSGGEFAVVLPRVSCEHAVPVASGIQKAAGALVRLHATDDPISISCGVASFRTSADFQQGLACAQLACRTAQDRGRGRVEVFHGTDTSMIRRFADGLHLARLRDALQQKGQLTLFAQKIVPIQGCRQMVGYEILLRSAESREQNVAPADLLAAAERHQMCSQLDWWVLEHAISQATRYRTELISRQAWLSLNISGPSLTDKAFVDRVHELVCSSGLIPALITFEIIESAAVSLTKASSCIAKMRDLGYRFALDDFGTGINSLKTLMNLPVHCVKIDGSFVRDILVDSQSEAMVRAMVSLARDLGISTIAEYAESTPIIERLRQLGVDYVQGYGIEHPQPFDDALASLGSAH